SRSRHTRLVSDWSSDVCSSDLWLILVERCLALLEVAFDIAQQDELLLDLGEPRRPATITGVTLARLREQRAHLVQGTPPPRLHQIGRASCRERGQVAAGSVW